MHIVYAVIMKQNKVPEKEEEGGENRNGFTGAWLCHGSLKRSPRMSNFKSVDSGDRPITFKSTKKKKKQKKVQVERA